MNRRKYAPQDEDFVLPREWGRLFKILDPGVTELSEPLELSRSRICISWKADLFSSVVECVR